jgi:hypothetical protein
LPDQAEKADHHLATCLPIQGLFYLFNLEDRVPASHLPRRISRVVTRVLTDLHEKLASFYSEIGRPISPPLCRSSRLCEPCLADAADRIGDMPCVNASCLWRRALQPMGADAQATSASEESGVTRFSVMRLIILMFRGRLEEARIRCERELSPARDG